MPIGFAAFLATIAIEKMFFADDGHGHGHGHDDGKPKSRFPHPFSPDY
jgi:hypothetical protein